MNKLAIILLNWNGHKDTIECIQSIRENENLLYTVFLLDNGSKTESVAYIEKWIRKEYNFDYNILNLESFNDQIDYSNSTLYFIKSSNNLGFAKGNNVIWEKIKNMYEYVMLLNNDTVIEDKAISKMVSYMDKNQNVGVVSCDIRLYKDKEKLWNAGGYFTWYGDRKYYKQRIIDRYKDQDVESIKTPFVTGCAMMVKHTISISIGLFTEKFFFGEEDFNYCKRLKKENISVMSYLNSTIYHKVGTSIRKNQKNINSYILHFSNRIINQKEFYSKVKWFIWKNLYMIAIFLKVWRTSESISNAFKVIKYIKYYTKNYNSIDYKTFSEINSID
jgi:GT2 family glycosyltransferase